MKTLPYGAHLYTAGWLCVTFQRSPDAVRRILEAAEITPAITVNGIEHFDGAALVAMREASADD